MESVTASLLTLLEESRKRCANHAKEEGLPVMFPTHQSLVRRQGTSGWRLERRPISRNAIELWPPQALTGVLGDNERELCLAIAHQLRTLYPDSVPFWDPFPRPCDIVAGWNGSPHQTFDEDPDSWVGQHVVLPAVRAYLRRIDSLDTPSLELAAIIAAEAQAFLADDQLTERTTLYVAGLITDRDTFERNGVTIRRLSEAEQGLFAPNPPGEPLQNVLWDFGTVPLHAIEILTRHSRRTQPSDRDTWRQPLLGLLLLGYELAGPARVASVTLPDWMFTGVKSAPAPLANHVKQCKPLCGGEFDELCATMQTIDGRKVGEPQSSGDLALHRFAIGCARTDPVDALLDFVITLEALLLPYDKETRQADLGYRFRLHGAYYLCDEAANRPDVWSRLRNLYGLRSRIVHGSSYPGRAEVAAGAIDARGLAAAGLRKAVRAGFPEAAAFNLLLLNLPPEQDTGKRSV